MIGSEVAQCQARGRIWLKDSTKALGIGIIEGHRRYPFALNGRERPLPSEGEAPATALIMILFSLKTQLIGDCGAIWSRPLRPSSGRGVALILLLVFLDRL